MAAVRQLDLKQMLADGEVLVAEQTFEWRSLSIWNSAP